MKKGIIGILNNPATSLNSYSVGIVNIVKAKNFDKSKIKSYKNW